MFDCLRWKFSTLVVVILGTPILALFPLRLLWCYFIHGIQNKPVAHTANTDGFKNAQPTPAVTGPGTMVFQVQESPRDPSFEPEQGNGLHLMEPAQNVLAMNASYNVPIDDVDEARKIKRAFQVHLQAQRRHPPKLLATDRTEAFGSVHYESLRIAPEARRTLWSLSTESLQSFE